MKVSLKNARALFYLSLLNILVCGLIYYSIFQSVRMPFLYLLLAECCLVFILTLVYLISLLIYLSEATAIVAAFTMFTVMLLFNIINIAFPHLLKYNYQGWLQTLTLVISLLVAFRSLFIKNKYLKPGFIAFGAGMALISLPRIFVLFIATTVNGEITRIADNIGGIIVPLAICFILKRAVDLLKNEPLPAANEQAQTEIPSDEPGEI